MKKVLVSLSAVVVLLVAVAVLFTEQVKEVAIGLVTSDMYVAADTDAFDPGLPVGARFPTIRALHDGREISGIEPFILDKGMIFVANRSVDW